MLLIWNLRKGRKVAVGGWWVWGGDEHIVNRSLLEYFLWRIQQRGWWDAFHGEGLVRNGWHAYQMLEREERLEFVVDV